MADISKKGIKTTYYRILYYDLYLHSNIILIIILAQCYSTFFQMTIPTKLSCIFHNHKLLVLYIIHWRP